MQFENDVTEWSAEERHLLSLLAREEAVDAGEADAEADAILAVLRAEGHLRNPRFRYRLAMQIAAAVVLLVTGGVIGARLASQGTLESMLARDDLTSQQRVLLLQRAGSAYVRAAHSYASATAQTDSTAVEVASQVLIGAAQAVARNDLDGGLSPVLTTLLTSASLARGSAEAPATQPLIWF